MLPSCGLILSLEGTKKSVVAVEACRGLIRGSSPHPLPPVRRRAGPHKISRRLLPKPGSVRSGTAHSPLPQGHPSGLARGVTDPSQSRSIETGGRLARSGLARRGQALLRSIRLGSREAGRPCSSVAPPLSRAHTGQSTALQVHRGQPGAFPAAGGRCCRRAFPSHAVGCSGWAQEKSGGESGRQTQGCLPSCVTLTR